MSEEPLVFVHPENEPAIRVDKFLHQQLGALEEPVEVTRSQLKRWIEHSGVLINQKQVCKSGALVKPGAEVVFVPQYVDDKELEPFDFSLQILHEDSAVIVVNKPPGLTVHPGAGNPDKTLLNAVVHHFERHSNCFSEKIRPGIVHRLDRDTSGVMVIARNPAAHAALSQQFADRTVDRAYRTLVLSTPRARRVIDKEDSGVIDAPLARDPSNRLCMAVVESGKRAVTNWKVIERYANANLLEVKLQTGRTHQIRVHMNHVGSPVIGDRTYGNCSALPKALLLQADAFGRQALHAFRLGFVHPETKEPVLFESDLPDDFAALVHAFANSE
jgi:23S rRNA pseudouridine1911/1915/1917 synthase